LLDRADYMLKESETPASRDNYAQQLEAVRDFCMHVLMQYDKMKSIQTTIQYKKPKTEKAHFSRIGRNNV
jgi:hypothetical protein